MTAKLDAAKVTFTPAGGNPSGGAWKIKPRPFLHHTADATLLLFQGDGRGGRWEVTPLPFIETKDPTPVEHFFTVWDAVSMPIPGIRLSSSSHNCVAAYDDGLFDNVQQAKNDYPNHHVVSICTQFGSHADYADTENGNMDSEQAVQSFANGWVKGIYAARDRWENEVLPLIRKRGLKPRRWSADWTGMPHLYVFSDGYLSDATQWESTRVFDRSLARPTFLT